MSKYIIGYSYEEDKLVRYSNKKCAADLSEDWLEIEAESPLKAMEIYEEKFQEWKQKQQNN